MLSVPMLQVISVTYYVPELCAKCFETTGCMNIKTQWWPTNPMADHFIHSGNNLSALLLLYFGKSLLKCGPEGDKYTNTAQRKGFQYTRWLLQNQTQNKIKLQITYMKYCIGFLTNEGKFTFGILKKNVAPFFPGNIDETIWKCCMLLP